MSHNFRRVLPPDLTRVKRRRGRRGGRPGLRDTVRIVLHALICIGSASHEHCCARVSGCDSVALTRGDHRRTRTSTSRARRAARMLLEAARRCPPRALTADLRHERLQESSTVSGPTALRSGAFGKPRGSNAGGATVVFLRLRSSVRLTMADGCDLILARMLSRIPRPCET